MVSVILYLLRRALSLMAFLPVAVVVVFILINSEKNLMVTLKRNSKRAGRYGILTIILAICYCGVVFGVDWLWMKEGDQAVVSLNYLEASSGLNPNRTKFTASELISDEIMEEIIQENGITGISPEELKTCFSVVPLAGSEEVSLEQPYISTEYQLSFRNNMEVSGLNPKRILDSYSEAVKRQFAQNYSRKTDVLQIDFSDLDTADYMDVGTILNEKATDVWNYMNICSQENGSFMAESTGETFRTLREKVGTFRDVELENYNALVLAEGLSKDKGQYIAKLNYEHRLQNMNYEKAMAQYEINLQAVDMYERDMARIVLVPTRDQEGEFYMSRTKLGVDHFSDAAAQAASLASSISKTISANNYRITQLQNGTSASEEAERLIEQMKGDLQNLADLALKTVSEYDAKNAENYILVTRQENFESLKSSVLRTAKLGAVFMAAAAAAFALKPEAKKKGEKKSYEAV